MCLDCSEIADISTAELETAAPETQGQIMNGILYFMWQHGNTLPAASSQQRPRTSVMGLEMIIFPAVSRRNHLI